MDAYLIKGIQENNEADFAGFYQQYHAKLYNYFLAKTQSSTISAELVQTTFIKCWQHRHRLNAQMALSPQLFRIAKTTLIDLLRQKARQRLVSLESERGVTELPDAPAVFHPLLDEVSATLDKIPPQRSRIIRFRLQGMTNQEIADQMGISKKTVENQLNKAVKEIRRHIAAAGDPVFHIFLIGLFFRITVLTTSTVVLTNCYRWV